MEKCIDPGARRLILQKIAGRFHLRWGSRALAFLIFTSVMLLSTLVACGPSSEDLEALHYAPHLSDDFKLSTPDEQGLDPLRVAKLFYDAAKMDTLTGLLVVKNGYLIGEKYFHEGAIEATNNRQSVTKSYTSALVGIALDQGCLSSLDQKMMDFFPEFAGQLDDPRKTSITIRDMLLMRSGYPSEETTPGYLETLYTNQGDWLTLLADFRLTSDPGTEFQYSNLTSHLLGVIVARACGSDLSALSQDRLFSPMKTKLGDWNRDADHYNYGHAELYVTGRNMAHLGMLYLHQGRFEGRQIISADWVRDSLRTVSKDAYKNVGHFRDIGYGYQWWSARAGEHQVNFAWGHGGQLIVLVKERDMVIVVTANPFYGVHGSQSWKHEKAIIKLVSRFISALP